METLKRDIAYALRQMYRNPGFTLAVILMLALGIGANTAVFSVASQVILRPLPFREPGQLVHIRYGEPSLEEEPVQFSVPEFKDFQAQNRTFTGLMEYHTMSFVLIGREEPDRVQVGVVSSNFFDLLGVRPYLGRTFRPDDEAQGAEQVLMLSYAYWRSKIGGDPKIVGKTLKMNGQPITIIGILPPLPQYPGTDDVFMPTESCPFRKALGPPNTRNLRMITLYGRLKPGVTMEQAKADVSAIEGRLRKEYPAFYTDNTEHVSIAPIQEEMIGAFRPTLLILLGTVGLVLLLTCANVGILYSVRLLSREREIVLRSALGAQRGRIVRQLLTEGMLLSLLGGLAGLGLAAVATKPLALYAQRFTPLADNIEIDGRVLAFTLLLSLMTGLLFGLIPSLQVARQNLVHVLKEGAGRATLGAGRHRLRNALILCQVAISFVLLIAAGLAIRSTLKLNEVEAGVQMNVLSMSVNLPFTKYPTGVQVGAFFQQVYQRVGALPGVVSVGAGSRLPLAGGEFTPTFRRADRPILPGQSEPRADQRTASINYFKTVGIPVLRGRTFNETDIGGAPFVVAITDSLARRHFPGEDPVGKQVIISNMGPNGAAATIIGVVGDTRQNGLDNEPSDALYFAFRQRGGINMNLFTRTEGDPYLLVPQIREVIRSIDPEQPIDNIQTLEDVRQETMAPLRLTATLLGLFSVVAFAIMVAGISWVVAFGVTERRQEIGVRAALGADRGDLLGLVLKQGLLLVVSGLVLGAILALAVGRFLSGILFGIEPTDPATFVLVALAILLVAGIACLLPARKATRIQPALILRG